MKEKINNKSCSICNSEINGYRFYMTEDKKQYFCSEECAEQKLEETNNEIIWDYGFCQLISIVNN